MPSKSTEQSKHLVFLIHFPLHVLSKVLYRSFHPDSSPTIVPRVIPPLKILNMMTTVYPEDCSDKNTGMWGEDHLNKLEHVQLYITMTTPTRGDILLKLTSPSGTTSKLLSVRPEDTDPGQRWDMRYTFNQ